MKLSKWEIEKLAVTVLHDFRKVTGIYTPYTPVDQLAGDYLQLDVKFEKLSTNGSICGLTAYLDTQLKLSICGEEKVLRIKKNDVFLDSQFMELGNVQKLCGKRRFTLAHEVAHQLLFGLETEDTRKKYLKPYAMRKVHTPRELKTAEDWNEWQANALGAALLMPQETIEVFMKQFGYLGPMVSYDGWLNDRDRHIVESFSELFHVSKAAMIIRLKKLGYLIEKSHSEQYRPQKVVGI